ncbi:hypothetical protein HAX54_053511 [Datura stramonium]|uniref:Uncharacterized protein n=1 Tax=Datura stramonium TaxID=4076 RepID=A0ABS8T1M0_DATST|nr:hypothetical protein [Datura stramonium]
MNSILLELDLDGDITTILPGGGVHMTRDGRLIILSRDCSLHVVDVWNLVFFGSSLDSLPQRIPGGKLSSPPVENIREGETCILPFLDKPKGKKRPFSLSA